MIINQHNFWPPVNLIQAQRYDFGAHTYKRNGREEIFHIH